MGTVLIKLGGEVVGRPESLSIILAELCALAAEGQRVVVCHGGGTQASRLQERLGLVATKVAGVRVTDDATLLVMKYALAGEVSVDLTAAAVAAGVPAVGISAVSSGLVLVRRRDPIVSPEGGDPIDLGWVGEVVEVRPALLECLLQGGFVPFVNPLSLELARGPADVAVPRVYNLNADALAAAVAGALSVDHLLMVTDVPGVLRDRFDPSTRIPRLSALEAQAAIREGIIGGGMVPKVEEALAQLTRFRKIGTVQIVGAEVNAIREAVRSPGSRGTVLTRE